MRHWYRRLAPTAAAAVLVLSACGDDRETQTADANLASPEAGAAGGIGPDAVVIYPIGTAASLEPNAVRTEVERMQREQSGAAQQGGAADAAGQSGNQMAGSEGGNTQGAAMQGGGGATGAAGGGASFATLDRDGDGRLSPAEYAIHALPSETPARQGATNDENPPFVSDEALNKVVTSFRQLDANGDFFLSDSEFKPSSR